MPSITKILEKFDEDLKKALIGARGGAFITPLRETLKDNLKSELTSLLQSLRQEKKEERVWANGGWIEGREQNQVVEKINKQIDEALK